MRSLMRPVIVAASVVVVAGIGFIYWWYATPSHFRYVLTVELEVDGKRRTASSVIGVDYYPKDPIRMAPGSGGPSYPRGVAPIFDLGPRGFLIAALSVQVEVYRSDYGAPVPPTPSGLPILAYNLNVHDIWQARDREPVDLRLAHYPAFVWVPPSQDWRQARQLNYADIPNVVSPNIRVVGVRLTPDLAARIVTKLEPAPQWLVDMRAYWATHMSVPYNSFLFSIGAVETHFHRVRK